MIPYIKNEEEKVAREAKKIIGTLRAGVVDENPIPTGLPCNRVQGHPRLTETRYAEFPGRVDPQEVGASWLISGYSSEAQAEHRAREAKNRPD